MKNERQVLILVEIEPEKNNALVKVSFLCEFFFKLMNFELKVKKAWEEREGRKMSLFLFYCLRIVRLSWNAFINFFLKFRDSLRSFLITSFAKKTLKKNEISNFSSCFCFRLISPEYLFLMNKSFRSVNQTNKKSALIHFHRGPFLEMRKNRTQIKRS